MTDKYLRAIDKRIARLGSYRTFLMQDEEDEEEEQQSLHSFLETYAVGLEHVGAVESHFDNGMSTVFQLSDNGIGKSWNRLFKMEKHVGIRSLLSSVKMTDQMVVPSKNWMDACEIYWKHDEADENGEHLNWEEEDKDIASAFSLLLNLICDDEKISVVIGVPSSESSSESSSQ